MQKAARYWIDEILIKSPFAKPLGIEVVDAEPERVTLRLPFRTDLATVGNIVHGGAIATLIDVAGAAASASGIAGDDTVGGATTHLNVAYLAPAEGRDIAAEAVVAHRTRSQTVTDVSVRDCEGALIAKGTVTSRIFRRPAG
ncbi:uncharacterized domain 1-containing protein [Mesorhizobium albiziae]|uniref:Uncharacterized domain 1-containing protein n=1 Tax=Neomesorhizobium albiziae TaxID=335020 RepID=A0A1I4AMJ0_9HYPH|nr:PaaI family thioesterase [Mesorhizobium albiziae]GLS32952.1 hypothetical protein GCM10007937_46620 [Mesorhizobium albiziae]SFK57430.1 uncharacterized domain 1-containing protein [Mesorhizobium albiziae]